jgi:hypothetical protein
MFHPFSLHDKLFRLQRVDFSTVRVAEDRDQLRASVNTEMILRVPCKTGKFLTS